MYTADREEKEVEVDRTGSEATAEYRRAGVTPETFVFDTSAVAGINQGDDELSLL